MSPPFRRIKRITSRVETGVHVRIWPSIGADLHERNWCQLLLHHDPYHLHSGRGQVGAGKLSVAPSPSILAKGSNGATLTVLASVQQLRRAFTVDALPESASRPKAEAKWTRDL